MSTSYPVVLTKSGPVKGISKKTDTGKVYHSFQHIPYVEQPKGELRFRDPRPVKPWTETLDCTKEGDTCYMIETFITGKPEFMGGDDCLGVNIFTPNLKPWKPLPVCVWIYGGGFVTGSSSAMVYGPDLIVEKDVIMVSFNYRLGIFGFLSFEDPKMGIPGNAGLKDQAMALKWIKDNISMFGGDPNNITIFGVSAGGGAVHYLMLSPMSKGLFNKAIAMSGSAFNPWALAPKVYPECLKRLAIALGLTEDTDDATLFKAISECDPLKLITIDATLVKPEEKVDGFVVLSAFLPQVEPYISEMCFLPASPFELAKNAWSKDVDAIFGGCANETTLFHNVLMLEQPGIDELNKNHSYFLPRDLQVSLDSSTAHAKGSILKKLYYGEKPVSLKNVQEFLEFLEDAVFWHGMHRAVTQRQIGEGKGKTYMYRLNVEPSLDNTGYYKFRRTFCMIPHMKGTCHSEDLVLLFKMHMSRRFIETDDNFKAQQVFLNSFIEFIKYGNPSCQVLGDKITWEPLPKERSDNVPCMEICRDKFTIQQLCHYEKIKVWNSLYDDEQNLL